MAISFPCAQCGKQLNVKDELAGKKGRCPQCGAGVVIPSAEAVRAGRDSTEATVPPRVKGNSPEGGTKAPEKKAERTITLAQESAHQDTDTNMPASGPSAEYDFLSPAQAPDELGRLGNYRVLKVLGAGGMGVVFLAEDILLKRRVALKAMLPDLAASEASRKRFIREAQTAAALEHDHIVPIYQVGEDKTPSGTVPFIAMPFLKGESLDARLQREKLLPLPDVARIGKEIALGLAAAHAQGLIHRDIKPANVWLEARGESRVESREPSKTPNAALDSGLSSLDSFRVRILDFGLARDMSGEGTKLTQSGAIMGTPAYMAPEQAQGKKVDHRADLFSLGVLLYRLTTGDLPFQGSDTISTLMAVAMEYPDAPRVKSERVPERLSDFIMKLLEKEKEERVQSAGEVVEQLSALEAELVTDKTRRVPAPARSEAKPPDAHHYTCPECRAHIKTAQSLAAGKKARCPKCKSLVLMKAAEPAGDKTVRRDSEDAHVYGLQELIDVVQPEDDPEPDKAKKKKKAAASSRRSPVMVGSMIGGGVLLVLVVILALAFSGRGPSTDGTANSGTNQGTEGPGSNATGDGGKLQNTSGTVDNNPPPSGGFVSLFNGKDLTGWKTHPAQPGNWRVENGALVSAGAGGYLFTERGDWRDFHLRTEVLVKAGGNSGIFLRSPFDLQAQGKMLFAPTGYEAELFWSGATKPGRIKGLAEVAQDLAQPDTWITLEAIATGTRLVTRVNGQPAVDIVDAKAQFGQGHLVLQAYTAATEVHFRKIEIKDLSKPAMKVSPPPPPGVWITLFDGKDLSNWKPAKWKVENGHTEVGGGNLVTKDDFGPDYDLHVEFWVPLMAGAKGQGRGNSGVFLNGRHEIQVLDSFGIKKPSANDCGALYGVAAPLVNACKPPEEWQTFDISFQAPRVDGKGQLTKPGVVSVLQNGIKVLDQASITKVSQLPVGPSLAERGPIMLQQHSCPVRFRNIKLMPR